IYRDDCRRAAQPRTRGSAQADWPLREHSHNIADLHLAALRAAKPGAHDVGAHQHLLISERIRDHSQVRLRIRYKHVLSLAAVDRIAKAPTAHRAPATLRRMPCE